MMNISFSDVGNVASILGFSLTIIILLLIKRIKSFYIFRIRVPEISIRLQTIVSNISSLMNDYESSHYSIDIEVAKCEIALKSLRKKISGSAKKSVKELIEKLYYYQKNQENKTENNIRNIYVEALKIIEEIKEIQEDYKWER